MKSWAALIIRGEISIEYIHEHLGLNADFVYSSKTTHWQLNSKLSEEEPLENHLYELLKNIAPVRKQIQNLQTKAEVLFYCSVEYNTENEGGITLEPRILTLLAHLGAKLEIHRFSNSRELLINQQIQIDEEKTSH